VNLELFVQAGLLASDSSSRSSFPFAAGPTGRKLTVVALSWEPYGCPRLQWRGPHRNHHRFPKM